MQDAPGGTHSHRRIPGGRYRASCAGRHATACRRTPPKNLLSTATALAVLALLCRPLGALTVRALSLDELLANSSLIVRGTVLSEAYLERGSTVLTAYELSVDEVLASAEPAGTQARLVFYVPGGVKSDGLELVVPGTPRFSAGQEVCLFLRPSPSGPMVVGHFLGAYTVTGIAGGKHRLQRLHPAGAGIIQDADGRSAAPDRFDYEEMRDAVRSRMAKVGANISSGGTVSAPMPPQIGNKPSLSDAKLPGIAHKPASVPRGTLPLLCLLAVPAFCLFAYGLAPALAIKHIRRRARLARVLVALMVPCGLASMAAAYTRLEISGNPVYWPDSKMPVAWYMNTDTTADCLYELNAVTASFQTWEDVPTARLTFRYAGAPRAEDDRHDGCNVIFWTANDPKGYFDAGTLALTFYWANPINGQMLDADVVFNDRDYNWTTRAEGGFGRLVECVATHEIGHVLGLGHSPIPEATMYAYYHTGTDTLHQDDIDGITAIYPDTTPPAAPVITTNGGADFDATEPDLILEGTMSADTWRILVNGSGTGVAPFIPGETYWRYSTTLTSPDTVYTFEVTAQDAAGNASPPDVIRVTYRPSWPKIERFYLYDLSTSSQEATNWPVVGVHVEVSGQSPVTHFLLTDKLWTPTVQDMLDYGLPAAPARYSLPASQGRRLLFLWVMDEMQHVSGPAAASILLDSVDPLFTGCSVVSQEAIVADLSEPVAGAENTGAFRVVPGDLQPVRAVLLSPQRLYLRLPASTPAGSYSLSVVPGTIMDATGENPLFIASGAGDFTLDGTATTASAVLLDYTHTLVLYSREVANAAKPENYRLASAGFAGGLSPTSVEYMGGASYRLVHPDIYQYLLDEGYDPSDFPVIIPFSIRNVFDPDGVLIQYNYPVASPSCCVLDLTVEATPAPDTEAPTMTDFWLAAVTSGSTTSTESRLVTVSIAATDARTGIIRWYLTESDVPPTIETVQAHGATRAPKSFLLASGLGLHTVYVYVLDAAGNLASSSASIELVANAAPAPAIGVQPAFEDVPPAAEILVADAGSSDPEGGAVDAAVDPGAAFMWLEPAPATVIYSEPADYTVALYVKDIWGATAYAETTVIIFPDTAPPTISVPAFTLHGRIDVPAIISIDIDGVPYPVVGGAFDAFLTFAGPQHEYQVTVSDGVNPPTVVRLNLEEQ